MLIQTQIQKYSKWHHDGEILPESDCKKSSNILLFGSLPDIWVLAFNPGLGYLAREPNNPYISAKFGFLQNENTFKSNLPTIEQEMIFVLNYNVEFLIILVPDG